MARLGLLQRIRLRLFPHQLREPGDASRWARDDLAECVTDGPWFDALGQVCLVPPRGHVAIVREIVIALDQSDRPAMYLAFARWPGALFNAAGFRKLTPRADAASAADAAFIAQIKGRTFPSPAPSIGARLKRILS